MPDETPPSESGEGTAPAPRVNFDGAPVPSRAPEQAADGEPSATESPASEAAPSPQRQKVCTMVLRSLGTYRSKDGDFGGAIALMALTAALWGAIAFGLTAFIWVLLEGLGKVAGDWTNALLYGVIGLVALFGLARRDQVGRRAFAVTPETEPRLAVGKLEDVRQNTRYIFAYILGALLGMQAGLLFYTHGHAGVAGEPDLARSVQLTLDNLGQGVLFDAFEIYDFRFAGDRPERTFWGNNLEYVFRLGYNALAFILVFQVIRIFQMEGPLKDPPGATATPRETAAWIDERFRRNKTSLRQFPDETIFLTITARFLEGQYELARKLARCFPRMPVSDELRALYVDDAGEPIFPEQNHR